MVSAAGSPGAFRNNSAGSFQDKTPLIGIGFNPFKPAKCRLDRSEFTGFTGPKFARNGALARVCG